MSASNISASPSVPEQIRQRDGRSEPASEVNVGEAERLASAAGGGLLVYYGITRGTLGGLGLALLGGAFIHRGVTGRCAGYKAFGINTARGDGPRTSVSARHGAKVTASVTILRPREELYRYWRDLSNLPRVMRHLRSVESTGDGRSHWVAEGPMGTHFEWDAEIITERENELIGWRSVGDSDVDTAGSVHFRAAPDGRGTEVEVTLKYDPPAGKLGGWVAWAFGESPAVQIYDDLFRFKQLMERNPGDTQPR